MTALAFVPADFSQYGGGWVDYSDLDFAAGTGTSILPDAPYTVSRNLAASANNTRLNRPFVGWQYWDNTAKLVRARSLDDVIGIRIDVRIVADKINGVVRVAMNTPTIELVGLNMPLTADPGIEEKITVGFVPLEARNSFFQNGASFTITTNVPVTLNEFSPVFYPLGVGQ